MSSEGTGQGSGSRSSSAGVWASVIAVVVLAAVVGGGVAIKVVMDRRRAAEQAQRSAVAQIEAETDAARKAAAEEYEKNDGMVSSERQRQLLEKIEAVGQQAGGDAEKVTTAIVAIGRDWTDMGDRYTKFVSTFAEAGGLAPQSLTSLETIDARLRMLQEGRAVNDEIARSVRGGSARLEAMLIEKGMRAQDARANAAAAAAKWGTMLEMRDIQTRFLQSATDYLTVLREQWGAWEISGSDGTVMFERQEAADRFNDASQRVLKASEEEAAWMKAYAK